MEEMCPSVPPVEEVKASIVQEVGSLVAWVSTCQSLTFFAFEAQLVQVLALGRLFIQLFLCMRKEQFQETHPQPQPGYKRIGPISRSLGTFLWFVPSQKAIDGTSLFSKPNILPQPRRSNWSPPKY
jgi:hypothetical protein